MGKGELNAAYEGVDLLVQVLMPPLAGRLYAQFASPAVLPPLLRWGGGGTYVIGALLMAMSSATLISTPAPRPEDVRGQKVVR